MKLENEVPNALSETLLRKACFQNLFVLDADGTWNGPTIAFVLLMEVTAIKGETL